MARDRYVPDSARLITARLSGAAQRHASWHQPDERETAAAVAEFAQIIGGRHDGPALLAEVADLALGTAEGKGPEYQAGMLGRLPVVPARPPHYEGPATWQRRR